MHIRLGLWEPARVPRAGPGACIGRDAAPHGPHGYRGRRGRTLQRGAWGQPSRSNDAFVLDRVVAWADAPTVIKFHYGGSQPPPWK